MHVSTGTGNGVPKTLSRWDGPAQLDGGGYGVAGRHPRAAGCESSRWVRSGRATPGDSYESNPSARVGDQGGLVRRRPRETFRTLPGFTRIKDRVAGYQTPTQRRKSDGAAGSD